MYRFRTIKGRKKEEGRRKKEEGRRNPPLPPPRGEIQEEGRRNPPLPPPRGEIQEEEGILVTRLCLVTPIGRLCIHFMSLYLIFSPIEQS
ncbi:MAG: hypothetical protein ACBR12_15865 [Microcoleus sp.]